MAAKKPTRPAPAPPAQAPLPAVILSGPRLFAAQLAPSEPVAWRYAAPVVTSAVLSGVAYVLVMRHLATFLAGQPGATGVSGFSAHLTNALGSAFLTLLAFALMWGLGHLGAGKAGRPAEVYGATFALLIPLWILVIVWTLLTPTAAFLPDPATLAALHGQPRELERAALTTTARTPAAALLMMVTLLGSAAQFGLAFPALAQLTGRTRAALGTLLPVLPVLAVQFISIAPLLVAL